MGRKAEGWPGPEAVFSAVREVLTKFRGTPITVRQLYYRLVAGGIISNEQRNYKNLGAWLTEWRRQGSIPYGAFEDRTRGMSTHDSGWRTADPDGWLFGYLDMAIRQAKNYHLARWAGQQYRVVVAVEKQALEGIFEGVCSELHVDLAVCRGYPSLTFIKEIADSLDTSGERENIVLYFGDFDPSGINIPETIERDLSELFGASFTLKRIALNIDQAHGMDLIPAPPKSTDGRAAGFREKHGNEVFELDAIEPDVLVEFIRDNVNEYFDTIAAEDREVLEEEGQKRINKLLKDNGIEDFMLRLRKDAGKDDGGEEE